MNVRLEELLGIISNLNDTKKTKLSSLFLNPLHSQKTKKTYKQMYLIGIIVHVGSLVDIKHKGIKGFMQNVWRGIAGGQVGKK